MEKINRIPGRLITEKMVGERPKLRAFLKERMIDVKYCIQHHFRYDYERSLRLIMPIYSHKGELVAYQGRDVTGRAILPYITQPKGVDLGSTMFNVNICTQHRNVIIVEGILDALRTEQAAQVNACVMACFTSSPTIEQLLLIPNVEKVLVMLDNDAWTNYKKFRDLPMDIEPVILPSGLDPGSLTDDQFLDLNLSQYLP
jgi:DNA primase